MNIGLCPEPMDEHRAAWRPSLASGAFAVLAAIIWWVVKRGRDRLADTPAGKS